MRSKFSVFTFLFSCYQMIFLGVMAARGILENPAMFAGFPETPLSCVQDWIQFSAETGTCFTHFHHHLIYMCEKNWSKAERKYFNSLNSTSAVIEYLNDFYFCE